MSFSNKKIIKNSHLNPDTVHIDEHLATVQEEYIEKTSKRKLDEYQKEIDEFREKEINKAMEEATKIKEDAYNAGLTQAREEALLEARSEMELLVRKEWEVEFEKVNEQYFRANRYMMEQQEKLIEKKIRWIEENENDVVEILISSVKKILAREIYLEKDDVKKMIQESMKEINDKSKTVWVRVNPEVKQKIDSQEWDERKIEWIADPKLSKLDILIETETEWIDSTVRNKIENLKKIIEEWVNQNDLLGEA
jgi:flagellar biosynthesis/type III secretory pathway protein FliH